jgi:hypothetical protein
VEVLREEGIDAGRYVLWDALLAGIGTLVPLLGGIELPGSRRG